MNKRDKRVLDRITQRAQEKGATAEQIRQVMAWLCSDSEEETFQEPEPEEEKTFEYSENMRRVLVQQSGGKEEDERRMARISAAKEQRRRKWEQGKIEREAARAVARARQLQRKKESLLREEEKRKREREIEEEITRKCKTLGEDMGFSVNCMSLYLYADGACSKCGAEGYLLPFKGQTLCRDCLCEDDPDAEKKQFISSNFSQSVTIHGAGTGGGRFHGVNASWVLDRFEWADSVVKSLPYKLTGEQFRELRNELVEWSNLHPREEWRNARSMLLARFAGELAMYDIVPNNHGRRPGFKLKNPTDIGDML